MCLCALVCKIRMGRYTTRQMLAELHSALRSMVAEEQDTKLYATVARIVSPCAPEALIESRCTWHGHLACRRLCRMCLRARIRTQSLRLGLRASFGAHRKPRAARLRRWAEGIRALANESQQAAERAQLSVRPSMHTCSVPIRRDRSGLLWVCVARVLERGWVPLPLAAAAAAATLEYCVSSTQRARAAFFRRARHRLNGLNRRRRTAAARPRSSRESSRST